MGYWISRAGRIFSIPDHYEFVKAHPKLFGLPKIVSQFGSTERQPTLDLVISKGWIRARGDRRQGLTFEVAALNPDTLFGIREFLIRTKWDPDQKLMVYDGSMTPLVESASFFTSDAALAVAENPKRKRGRAAARRVP